MKSQYAARRIAAMAAVGAVLLACPGARADLEDFHASFLAEDFNPGLGETATELWLYVDNEPDSDRDVYDAELWLHEGPCFECLILDIDGPWEWVHARTLQPVDLPAEPFPIRWYTTNPAEAVPPGEELHGFVIRFTEFELKIEVPTCCSDVDDDKTLDSSRIPCITPEPATLSLLVFGGLALVARKRTIAESA